MNNFETTTEQIQNAFKLSPTEKRLMRESIVRSISAQPSPYGEFIARMGRSVVFRGTLAALIMTLIGGAGIVGVSAQALPGDTFYTTKINLEHVQSLLKTSPESKIAFEIKRTESRFDEVRQLVQDNNFDTTKQEIVSQQIEEHISIVTDEVTKVAFATGEKRTRIDTDSIKEVLETEQQSIAELVQAKSETTETTPSQQEADSLLALAHVATLTQEHVDTIEHIEETITAVLAETEQATVDLAVTTPSDLNESAQDTPILDPVLAVVEEKLSVEKHIADLQERIQQLYPTPVAIDAPISVEETVATLPVPPRESATLMTASEILPSSSPITEVPSEITEPISQAEKSHDDVTITYDLLVSAYKSENYAVAKALIAKLNALLDSLAPVAPAITPVPVVTVETPVIDPLLPPSTPEPVISEPVDTLPTTPSKTSTLDARTGSITKANF